MLQYLSKDKTVTGNFETLVYVQPNLQFTATTERLKQEPGRTESTAGFGRSN